MAMIVVISVMNGFEDDIKHKILGTQSHLVISSFSGGIENDAEAARLIRRDPDVLGATPYILSQGLISYAGGVQGVVVRGIDPATAPDVIMIKDIITAGSFAAMDATGVLVGSELAMNSGISVGDTITIISPNGPITPLGMIPKSMPFSVCGL